MASLGRKKVRSCVVAQLKLRRNFLKKKKITCYLYLQKANKFWLINLHLKLQKVITNAKSEVYHILNHNTDNTCEPLPQHHLIAEKQNGQELVQKEQKKGSQRRSTHTLSSAGQDVSSIRKCVAEYGEKWYPGTITGLSWKCRRATCTYMFDIDSIFSVDNCFELCLKEVKKNV
jgi:hypothetical protein